MKKKLKGEKHAAAVARSAAVRHRKHITHKVHHRKAYRVRHVGSLALAVVFLMALMLNLGFVIGHNRVSYDQSPVVSTKTPASTLTTVRSAYGFAFSVDSNLLSITASAVDGGAAHAVDQNQLRDGKNLTSVTVRPRPSIVRGAEAAAQLSFQVSPDTAAFAKLRQADANNGIGENDTAAKVFPVTSSSDFDIAVTNSSNEIIDGVSVKKNVYQLTPRYGTSKTLTYAVAWSGVLDGKPFSLSINGLVGSSDTPSVFTPIFDTINLSAQQKVAAAVTSNILNRFATTAATPKVDSKYLSDLYSPAVVKIYHVVCGSLVYGGHALTEDQCSGATGSGFIASADGYIATNGHVVSYTAKDMFIEVLLSDPSVIASFLRANGLNNAQIIQILQRPDLLADVITKIYDLPDSVIKFDDQREATLVAFGAQPIKIQTEADIQKLTNFDETPDIKKATIVGMDYSSKESLIVELGGNTSGFKASDVALLKADVSNAPFIKLLSAGNTVTQNEKLVIMGFPGDAENQLIDNSNLSVTVTNGIISSIRDAAGGKNKLYQSDADASHGNSGGPAITEDGEVIGLLTYRVDSGESGNAAKSYIRDIADFKKLAEDNKVTFSNTGSTQAAWDKGITYFSQNRFTKAKAEFTKVKASYPQHRLVDAYISSANEAIKAGKDVKDFPVAALIVGIVVTLGAIVAAVVMIARHRSHHQVFQLNQQYGTVPAPGQPYPVSVMPPQPAVQPVLGMQQPQPPVPVAQSFPQPQVVQAQIAPQPVVQVITPQPVSQQQPPTQPQ